MKRSRYSSLITHHWMFVILAIVAAFAITRFTVAAPAFTDAFYHFNGANRLATGQGFTEPYLWTYIGAPAALPESGLFPSHLYWMPLTSIIGALGMSLPGQTHVYYGAQWPFALLLAGTAIVGFSIGRRLGGTARHAWVAGLLTLFSGYFTRFWGTMDTFAPYAFIGALCMVAMGLALTLNPSPSGRGTSKPAPHMSSFLELSEGKLTPRRSPRPEGARVRAFLWPLAGALAALAHLTRNDGVLLLLVGIVAICFWRLARNQSPTVNRGFSARFRSLFLFVAAYLIVMLPWFARNMQAVGSPLPFGGTAAIWFREYNDLFSFPPDSSPQTAFADGLGDFINARVEALSNNLGTFVAVEGLIVMTPFMLLGLWRRRRDPFLAPFALYALGLHLVMTLVFPHPGYRGGLFHSAAALVPFWAALGVVGVDDAVDWVAKRRRRWNARTAKRIFLAALVALAVYLSVMIGLAGRVPPITGTPPLYGELLRTLPSNARVMINDPAQLYFFTGFGGVALPNEQPSMILDIARRYDVDYLVLESPGGTPGPLLSLFETTPDFLTPIPLRSTDAKLYAIRR
jgi:hypothetical protein